MPVFIIFMVEVISLKKKVHGRPHSPTQMYIFFKSKNPQRPAKLFLFCRVELAYFFSGFRVSLSSDLSISSLLSIILTNSPLINFSDWLL